MLHNIHQNRKAAHMLHNKLFLISFLVMAVFLIPAFTTPGVPENILPISAMLSPHGSDTITWASGRYTAKGRNGTARTAARGIEVISTSSGGNLKIHLLNDYDSAGRIIWLVYPIPASGGFIQRIGFIFDMIDSAGTTITKTDIIIWY